MESIIIAIAIILVVIVVKSVVVIVRYSVAQRRVNRAYTALTRWNRRLEWAIEDGSWIDADNYEFSVDVLGEVVESRRAAFDKAVIGRDFIRF